MSAEPIYVLPVGTVVRIGARADRTGEPIEAKIGAVCIRARNHITYEVRWWNGRARNCEWLEAFEIQQPDDRRLKTIGFTEVVPEGQA